VIVQVIDVETATLLTRLVHVSGEWLESAYPLKLDLPPQQFGSQLSYGRRYTLQGVLCIAASDDDGAAAQQTAAKRKPVTVARLPKGEGISAPQRRRLFAIAREHHWSDEQMKEHLQLYFGIDSTKLLAASKYDAVCAAFSVPPVAAADMPL
jgi:ERF superfamily